MSQAFGFTNFILCYFIPMIILAYVYIKIFGAARQNTVHTKQSLIRSISRDGTTLESMLQSRRSLAEYQVSTHRDRMTANEKKRLMTSFKKRAQMCTRMILYKEETRAARIIAFILVMFLVCWTPYYLVTLINLFYHDKFVLVSIRCSGIVLLLYQTLDRVCRTYR